MSEPRWRCAGACAEPDPFEAIWLDSLARQFYLDDAKDVVAKGAVNGNTITLQLESPVSAGRITYLKELNWNQDDLIFGVNGIAALTFCNVPILPEKLR
jgi:hypothetical protein